MTTENDARPTREGEQDKQDAECEVPIYEIPASETDNDIPAVGISSPEEVEFQHAELLTCCADCGLAQHWSTDRYSPGTPFGESLGSMHHTETEHRVVELSFDGPVDRDEYPTVMAALDTDSSREDLSDEINRDELFEEMRELYRRGVNNEF